jgi:hypothetical protein
MKITSTIVSDDIRDEIGGKITLVGVYNRGLGLPPETVFPSLLPRLCILVRLELGADDPTPDNFALRLTFDGATAIDNTSPLKVLDREQPIQIRLAFMPFTLEGFGALSFNFSIRAQDKEVFAFSEDLPVFPVSSSEPRRATAKTA